MILWSPFSCSCARTFYFPHTIMISSPNAYYLFLYSFLVRRVNKKKSLILNKAINKIDWPNLNLARQGRASFLVYKCKRVLDVSENVRITYKTTPTKSESKPYPTGCC